MNIFLIVVYVLCALYIVLNFKHDMQMLQQNSYRIGRYWKYLKKYDLMSSWRLVDIAVILLSLSTLLPLLFAELLAGCVALSKCWLIFHKKHKKPLVFTKRVWRLYSTASVLALGAFIVTAVFAGKTTDMVGYYPGVSFTLAVAFAITTISWIFTIAAVVILMPVERSINNKYRNEAINILRSMPDLKVIGITGSYGKTSTKHYLNRILSEEFDVLMTPGSFNTPMGVIRTVREYMKPYDKIFICEMGAKQKGDIKEICDIVHPEIGIITAVGPMHLESFKTIENVQATKFELVDALPANGLAVINNDFEYCANRPVDNVKGIRFSIDKKHAKATYYVTDIAYTINGTTFILHGPDGFEHTFTTPLVGSCNVQNLTAAIIVALYLEVPVNKISYAVERIEQVEHRLSMKKTAGGVTIIDDAFNSNPSGARMALEVLTHFKNGKRIIVTPGMIELGDKQFELNRDLGKEIGKSVDIAIIVGHYNRDAIIEGLELSGFDKDKTYVVEDFNEAQKELATILKGGDSVLYENDLPDTFK